MYNLAYDPGIYGCAPAANIERTRFGTTVVRVADDRPSRPQLMMPFMNNSYAADPSIKFHTVRATRVGMPVAITIEQPPTYAQSQARIQTQQPVVAAPPMETWMPLQPDPVFIQQQPQRIPIGTWSQQNGRQILSPLNQPVAMPAQHQIVNLNQHLLTPGCQPVPIYRPQPGRMVSMDSNTSKTAIEMYAPRSFASEAEEVTQLANTKSRKQQLREKMRRKSKKKASRNKVILTAKVEKVAPPVVTPIPDKRSSPRKSKRRESVSSSSSSGSSSASSSSSEESSSESEDEAVADDVEKTSSKPKKKMKKGPRVKSYLEYSIVGLFFNILFGTVAIVLSVSSMQSRKQRKFRQARWEGVCAAVTTTLGILVSAIIVVVVLLYIYTNTICNECDKSI